MEEKRFSCIKQVVKTVQIALPATFICNEISGCKEILDSWKRQYSKQLQGVVVNYKLYSILEAAGFTTVNKPYILYNVKAAFDLFCPKIGDIVKAKINRISKEHIVLLIENTINVTIHLSKDSSEDLTPFIYLNSEILFEVLSFSFDQKMVLSVRGKITHKCIQLMRELFPPQPFSNLVDAPELSNNTDEGIGTSSESGDDRLKNHTFEDSKINDDVNFKKPFTSSTKSKKKSSKKLKSDSESSSMDTSDISTSDEKPKKKKKYNDKFNPDVENYLNANNLSSDTVSSNTLIQNFSSLNHSEVLEALKEEESHFEDNIHVKKHKKKQRQDLFPDLIGEPTKSKNQTVSDNSNLDINISAKVAKSSKKRKRERESSFMDISEQSLSDKVPKKKKKFKDKTVPLDKEIKNELLDIPDDTTISATILSLKSEISSPVKNVDNFFPECKVKKKNKDKKNRIKDKSKKKKGKIKKDNKSLKKDSKKSKDGEKCRKHKKDKSHKKGKSDEKKDSSKNEIPFVIKSEID